MNHVAKKDTLTRARRMKTYVQVEGKVRRLFVDLGRHVHVLGQEGKAFDDFLQRRRLDLRQNVEGNER